MQQLAYFSFHGNLNDFLRKQTKGTTIPYSFKGMPAVKDAIEAIGIPHVEVEWILMNGHPSQLGTLLLPHQRVEVYPVNSAPKGSLPAVRDNESLPCTFVLDVHLGALTRLLRLLGLDTHYQPDSTDQELAQISYEQHRALLTRDVPLLKQKIIEWGYWLRSQHPHEQLLEVIRRYNLVPHFKPFTRCLACNGFIYTVEKETVLNKLPSGTKEYYNEFYQCSSCQKVYWKGSHYHRMQEFLKGLRAQLGDT